MGQKGCRYVLFDTKTDAHDEHPLLQVLFSYLPQYSRIVSAHFFMSVLTSLPQNCRTSRPVGQFIIDISIPYHIPLLFFAYAVILRLILIISERIFLLTASVFIRLFDF